MLSNEVIRNRLTGSNDDIFNSYGGVCRMCQLEQEYGSGCLTCGKGLDLIEKKSPDSFNLDQKNAIKTISGNVNNSVPFGSFIFRAQYFPGDIDVIEFVNVCNDNQTFCGSTKDLIIKVWQILISIIQKIETNKNYYYSESKIGKDHRFHIDVDDPFFIDRVKSLHDNKLLKNDEFSLIMKLYGDGTKKNSLSELDKDTINEFFRLKYTLRWSAIDILNGYKILEGNKVKYILDALQDMGPIKIDIFVPINGNFIEITNFFVLVEFVNGKEHIVNIDFDYLKSIRGQIKKLSSKLFFKPFKLAKRMWALARYLEDEKILKILTPLLESNAARIYQINSEIETLILMFERIKVLPLDIVFKQIDNFKSRLVLAYDIKFDQQLIYGLIDKIVSKYDNLETGRKPVIDILKQIKDYLSDIINKYALNYMKKNKLFPIPKKYIGEINNDDNYIGGIGTKSGAQKGAKVNPYVAYQRLTGSTKGYKKGQGKKQVLELLKKSSSKYEKIIKKPDIKIIDEDLDQIYKKIDDIINRAKGNQIPLNKFLPKKIKGKIPLLQYSPKNNKFFLSFPIKHMAASHINYPLINYEKQKKQNKQNKQKKPLSDRYIGPEIIYPENIIEFVEPEPVISIQPKQKQVRYINEELLRQIEEEEANEKDKKKLNKLGKKQKKEFNFNEYIDKESKKIIRKLLKSGKFNHKDIIKLLSGSQSCNVNVHCPDNNKSLQLPENIINFINKLSDKEVNNLNNIVKKNENLSIDKLTDDIYKQFPELSDKLNNIKKKKKNNDAREEMEREEDNLEQFPYIEPEYNISDEELKQFMEELEQEQE